jgi:Small-conductance mechanosensitive channel
MKINFSKWRKVLWVVLVVMPIAIYAQKKHGEAKYVEKIVEGNKRGQDSLKLTCEEKDSLLIDDLRYKLQEYQLNEIVLRNQLYKTGESARIDSINKVRKRAQIDSLRTLTPGVPIVVEGDTLFKLYARRGGVSPVNRAQSTKDAILKIGKRLSFVRDSLYIFESDYASDVMFGDKVIVSLTDQDGLWQNTTRSELAKKYMLVISKEISLLQEKYGLRMKIQGFLLGFLIVAAQIGLIFLTNRSFRKLRRRIVRLVNTRLKPLKIKDYEYLDVHKQGRILLFSSNVARLFFILIQLVISIPILFSIFPETKNFAYTLFSYIWNPAKDILLAIVYYVPKIFKIIIIYICFKYFVRGMKYMASEIATEKLKISGFYPDWAFPTYYILRFLTYSFMLIMIWPLLPSSNSEIFQGVSVFIGLVISLGSTTVIGNLMAGLVTTYMRPFKVGDRIKLQDTEGDVIEKTPFVTRIRTPKNDIITVPNSFVLSSQTLNYSSSAQQYGIIVHSTVSISYDVEWSVIENLLIRAALHTKGILHEPEPFVLATALNDFYCCYEINAYTKEAHSLPVLYSDLHKNILDFFNEAGVEIMSPHFFARRDGEKVQIPLRHDHNEVKKS